MQSDRQRVLTLRMDEKSVFSFFIMKSLVCVQFIMKTLVDFDKRNINKEIVFLYIRILLALVLQISRLITYHLPSRLRVTEMGCFSEHFINNHSALLSMKNINSLFDNI